VIFHEQSIVIAHNGSGLRLCANGASFCLYDVLGCCAGSWGAKSVTWQMA